MTLHDLTLVEARKALLDGQVSAAEYAQALVDRSLACTALNALASTDFPALLDAARAQDAAGTPRDARLPLAGVPLLLKDNIDTAALPTTGGTPALRGRVPQADAPCARRLFAAGALLGGKTNMHELAFGITTNNAWTGPVRNPWDPSLIPGGSSGGAGAAVAARMAPAAVGTDTGASVRLPASLCGVVGFRPSVGRYPGGGVVPISRTRDTPGPLARSVEDCALVDQVMAGDGGPLESVRLDTLRIGLPRGYFFSQADVGVLDVVEDAVSRLSGRGVTFVEAEVPHLAELNAAVGFPVALFELLEDLPAYLAAAGYGLTIEDIAREVASPDVRAVLASQLGDQAMRRSDYEAGLRARERMRAAYAGHFASLRLDALMFPTAILPPRRIGEDETVELNGVRVPTMATYIRNTDPASNAGIPGISLPAGLDRGGLPVGIELDAPDRRDRRLLAIARAIEHELPVLPAPPMACGV